MKPACFAPYFNLNFDVAGNVTVCCYNKSVVLGNIKDSVLSQILQSPQLIKLQEKLNSNDFSMGCYFCEQNIKAGNEENALFKEYDQYFISQDELNQGFIPKSIELEISNNCNLACVMCYGKYSSTIRKTRESLSPVVNSYPENFAEQLYPYLEKIEVIKFLGGEPFLNPHYFKIWEKVGEKNPNIKLVVTTNGTVFNEKIKKLISKLNFEIVISTDSLTKENFEKIRIGGSFEKFYENIQQFKQLLNKKGRRLNLTVCPLMENYREIPELIALCEKENLGIHFNTVVNPIFHSTLYKNSQIQSQIISSWKDRALKLFGEKGNNKLWGLISLQETQLTKTSKRKLFFDFLNTNGIHISIIDRLKIAFNYSPKLSSNRLEVTINEFKNFIEIASLFFEVSIKTESLETLIQYIENYSDSQFLMSEILTFDIENMLPFFATGTPENLLTQLQYQFP